MKYGVIGGGVLGLTVALRLAQRGHVVEVLERDSVPGGLAAGFEVEPGIWLERYYHHLFRSDAAAIRLINEVGVGPLLEWYRPSTTVLTQGAIRQLDSPGSLLRFDALPVSSRLRTAAAIAVVKVVPTPRLLGRFTAAHWMARVGGDRAFRVIWEPLLRAKFGDHADTVAMAWLWARIHDRTTSLGYVRGGFHRFYEALASAVGGLGGTLTFQADVRSIVERDSGFDVEIRRAGGIEMRRFDRVVATVPPTLLHRLAPQLGGPSAPPVDALSAQCLILALDRSLTDVYWIGVAEAGWPYLAVVEHTRMLPTSDYKGRTLVYLGAYRDPSDPILSMDAARQLELAGPLLREINPAFDPSWVTDSWSFVAPFAQPIVGVAYDRSIPGFDTDIPGLYIANMFQVYPHDRGQNYSVELAEGLVRHLERQ